MPHNAYYGIYKLIGHTAAGIEVWRNEDGYVRLQRGQNIIADELQGYASVGDVHVIATLEVDSDDTFYSGELFFEYTLVDDAT